MITNLAFIKPILRKDISMKRKRLDRDGWREYNKCKPPRYYQMRVDTDDFRGLVCPIQWIDGQYRYWNFSKSGKRAVIGEGMTWLQLIPDGKKRVITAMYLPDYTLSVCYVDVIENLEYDPDGVAVFIDKYLDVVFTPQDGAGIDDRDELDEAFQSGDITKAQYDSALDECDSIMAELCADIAKTEKLFLRILDYVNGKIHKSECPFS